MRKLKILFGLVKIFLPESVVRLLYAGRRTVVAGRTIDPKAQAAGELVALIRDPDDIPTVEESRAQLLAMGKKFERPGPDTVTTRDIMLPGADGDRRARIYIPKGLDPMGDVQTLFYLHGGGWVQGAIESHDGLCARLADLAGIRVVSYDYRLAPEHPFPAAADDILACYTAIVAGETDLTMNPSRLIVGGDSAGGNLSACLMHDLVKADLPIPRAQLLIYPGVDARLATQSMQDLRNQPLLPASRIDWYLGMYIPEGHDRLDPRISPLFSDTHDRQPEAMIVAGGHDPLWDDALAYAAKLRDAGVEVFLQEYPGQIHAFMSLTKVLPQGNDAIHRTAIWLKQTFAPR